MNLYDFPEYFEVAFDFRDLPQEVDFFEALIQKSSRIPVRQVLELACGGSPYLSEWHRRGYSYTGLDINPTMLKFARARARTNGIQAEFVQANMRRFAFARKKFDLAYVLLGSLYLNSNEAIIEHLNCVGRALRPGGLYVLDGVVQFKIIGEPKQRWTMRRRGITVKTTYEAKPVNSFEQLVNETLSLRICDRGKKRVIRSAVPKKLIFPQELLLLLKEQGQFEYLSYYRNFRLKKSKEEDGRKIVVLRRR